MNLSRVQISELGQFASESGFQHGYRPLWDRKKEEFVANDRGFVQVVNNQGLRMNSLLRKDEWEALDAAVVEAARTRLNAIQRLRDRGLVKPLDSMGILASQWNVASEVTRAEVNITGQTTQAMDQQDYLLKGVPVPVIHKSFQIGERTLQASRRLGEGIDVTNAYEASRVVAEELERMFFSGNSDVQLNNQTIYGVTNETNVNTEATAYDFGTIDNVLSKFQAMLGELDDDNMHGPFEVWIATTQYTEITTSFYTDGSGESAMQRMLRLPQISNIWPGDYLTDGSLVMVQMSPNVVDLALHKLNMVVEWSQGDGMTHNFKVMSIAVPRVKSDYSGNSGICYGTAA